MDSYGNLDTYGWTPSFVSANRAECLYILGVLNSAVERFLREKKYPEAVLGMKKISVGLIKMENENLGDFTKQDVMLALMMPATAILGILDLDAPESSRREIALQYALEMATDPNHELAACYKLADNEVNSYIADLKSGAPLALIKRKYNFPDDIFDCLTSLDQVFSAPSSSQASSVSSYVPSVSYSSPSVSSTPEPSVSPGSSAPPAHPTGWVPVILLAAIIIGVLFFSGAFDPLFSNSNFSNSKVEFSDVADDAYYAEAVKWAVNKEITNGTDKTAFSPKETCTVAQVLTFLYRANGSPKMSISNPFTDVSKSKYYYNAALWAYQNGLVSESSFDPSAPCTRSMVVTYLWKLAGSPETAGPATPTASSLEYAPYTISGTSTYTYSSSDSYGPGIGESFTVQFDAAVTTQAKVTLHNDSLDGEMVRDYWEPRTYDITLVAVHPDSKYTIDGGFYGETEETMSAGSTVDVAWINGVPGEPYFRANDNTFRFAYGGRGYLDEEFALYEDSLSEARLGGSRYDSGTPDCGVLIQLDETYYFVTYADSAIAAGLLNADSATSFSDVPSNASYAQAVAWAVENGITTGDSANTFSPDKTCTRGQIVTFLYRALA